MVPGKVGCNAWRVVWNVHIGLRGLYRSAIEGGQIALPLTSGLDEIEGLKAKIPPRRVLMTLAESAKEYKE